jgi:hypothetical protein
MNVVGLDGVLAGFERAELEIGVAADAGIAEGADIIAAAWVANIEADDLVLTGAYRDSIHADASGDEATVSSDVPYAGILEYGDSRQIGHAVAQRALDDNGGRALDAVSEKLRAVLA